MPEQEEASLKYPKKGRVRLEGHRYWLFKQHVHSLDLWRCKVCGKIKPLTVHHILPRSHRRLDTIENAVSVDVECHEKIERKEIAVAWENATERKLMVIEL